MKEKKNKVGGILGFAIFRNRKNALGTSRIPPPYHNAPNIIAHMSTVLHTAIAQEWAVWGERWPSGLGSRPATGRSMVRVPLR